MLFQTVIVINLCEFEVCEPRAPLEQRCKQPTRRNKFRLLIFSNQFYMFRATNSPILSSTFWLYIQLLVQCTDIAADRWPRHRSAAISVHCTERCIYSLKKNCSWGWASLSPGKCRADWNRSEKKSINEHCCIFLVAYIDNLCEFAVKF